VLRLGEADLAFTADEVRAFAALRGVPLARVDGAGGWPALAELSARTRTATVAQYVGEEVLADLSPGARRALGLLAHLDRFDEALAWVVAGPQEDGRAPEELLDGIPLVTRHADGCRSLHGLWRTLLAGEVRPDEVADARRRAAAELLARGDMAGAVRLLFEARAWPELGQVLVEAVAVAFRPLPYDVLAGWAARLPPEVQRSPSGRLLRAVLAGSADRDEAREELRWCAAEFRRLGDAAGELASLVQLGELAWWTERPDDLAAVAQRVFELEAGGATEAAVPAALCRALAHDAAREHREALEVMVSIRLSAADGRWRGLVAGFRIAALAAVGEMDEALALADRSLASPDMTHRSVIEQTRVHALWVTGRTEDALAAMPSVLELAGASGYRTARALAYAGAALMEATLGDITKAAGDLTLARAWAISDDAPMIDTSLSMAGAALEVARGDEEAATDLLRAHLVRRRLAQPGQAASGLLHSMALLYVLVPETRDTWDAAELPSVYEVARDLARALVGVRENGALPPGARLPEPSVVAAHLPLPWAVRLGVAAVAAQRSEGAALLEARWPVGRDELVAIAEEGGRLGRAARSSLSRLPVPPTGRLELSLLGPLELRRDGVPVTAPEWRRERVRSLLAHLALHGTVSRDRVARDLWPTLDSHAQSRNLRVTLTYLLKVLEPQRRRGSPSYFVRPQGTDLVLHGGDRLAVDLWAFDAHAEAAAEADRDRYPSVTLENALEAVGLWRGEAKDLADEEWAVGPLEHRRSRVMALATRAGELLLARNRTEHARALAEQVLAMEPWSEAAHRLAVAAHQASDDVVAAQRALARYRDAVRDLGIDPDHVDPLPGTL
jgi:DNA-binding SARP family transcriptional activator